MHITFNILLIYHAYGLSWLGHKAVDWHASRVCYVVLESYAQYLNPLLMDQSWPKSPVARIKKCHESNLPLHFHLWGPKMWPHVCQIHFSIWHCLWLKKICSLYNIGIPVGFVIPNPKSNSTTNPRCSTLYKCVHRGLRATGQNKKALYICYFFQLQYQNQQHVNVWQLQKQIKCKPNSILYLGSIKLYL